MWQQDGGDGLERPLCLYGQGGGWEVSHVCVSMEGVQKAPMSMYVEKKLGRPPCLCEQGEGWEGPHIYVYKEGIEKALMFVCAGRG